MLYGIPSGISIMLLRAAIIGAVICGCLSAGCATTTIPRPTSESRFVSNKAGNNVIIFVHGVFGGPNGTWCNDTTGKCWWKLIDEDSDFRSDRVYLVGYDTPLIRNASNIEETAQHVLQELDDGGLFRYEHIYFVAHSMGGLIVKRILNILDKPSRIADLRRVRAVLLISTPSQGAPAAELGVWLSMNPQLRDLRSADFNTFLQGLENDWLSMLHERDRAHANYPQVFCAYETQPTYGIHVVSRVYSTTRCDNVPFPMDYDHLRIVKPPNVGIQPYPWAKARIQEADELANSSTSDVVH